MPRQGSESFLLFAKGACKAPCPFSETATLIPAQLSEIREYEINQRNNHSNPMSRSRCCPGISCQVMREPCNCRHVFGADAHQGVIPTHVQAKLSTELFKFSHTIFYNSFYTLYDIPSGIQSGILSLTCGLAFRPTFYLAFFLTFFLTFYLAFFLAFSL